MVFSIESKSIKLCVKDTVSDGFEKFDSFEKETRLCSSLIKAIVDAYNGRVGVESTLENGSILWAVLPTTINSNNNLPEKQRESKDNAAVGQDISKLRLLVAEDNDSNYKLLEILLRGYNIKRAHNGAQALEMAQNEQFDIVLMDIRMPVMDGLEATKRIRNFNHDIPIIAVTANTFDEDKAKAYEAGVNDFLTKPLNKNHLIEALKLHCLK